MVANRLGYLVHAALDHVGPPVSVGGHRGIGPAWQRDRCELLTKGDRIGKRGHRSRDVLMDTRIARRDPDVAAGRLAVRGVSETRAQTLHRARLFCPGTRPGLQNAVRAPITGRQGQARDRVGVDRLEQREWLSGGHPYFLPGRPEVEITEVAMRATDVEEIDLRIYRQAGAPIRAHRVKLRDGELQQQARPQSAERLGDDDPETVQS